MKELLVALVSLSVIMATPVQSQSVAVDTAGVVLEPGDAIRITVLRNPELSGEFIIGPDGSIVHPLYRELKVTGIPLSAVEDRVRTFLSRFETTPAFVILPEIRIVVAGEVRQPNMFTVPVGTSLVEAIALAGGPTDRGQIDRVQLLRDRGSQVLNLRRPDAPATRVLVRSGDQIVVPRSRNVMQDFVLPSSSILAGLAALSTLILQLRR